MNLNVLLIPIQNGERSALDYVNGQSYESKSSLLEYMSTLDSIDSVEDLIILPIDEFFDRVNDNIIDPRPFWQGNVFIGEGGAKSSAYSFDCIENGQNGKQKFYLVTESSKNRLKLYCVATPLEGNNYMIFDKIGDIIAFKLGWFKVDHYLIHRIDFNKLILNGSDKSLTEGLEFVKGD